MIAVLLALLALPAGAEQAPPGPPVATRSPRLGPLVQQIVRAREAGADPRLRATRLRVDLDAAGRTEALVALADGREELRLLPVDALDAPLAEPGVRAVRLPPPAWPFATSQGVSLTGAAALHAQGVRGQGVRVCVIDTGFQNLSALVQAGELPPPAKTKNFTGSPLEATSGHGTAVAEIVHEMAPEADLLLAKIAHLADFKQALDWAADKGARVANVSLGFPGANFSDGTGPAAKAVKKARKRGVLAAVAAGNAADAHWLGGWQDPDKDKFLDFAPGDEGLTFQASAGDNVSVHLVWDDFPKSDVDYDLSVFYVGTDQNPLPPSENTLVGSSTAVQDGDLAPFESVSFQAPQTGNYAAFVFRVHGKLEPLALFLSHPIVDGNVVPASSVLTPGDAAASLTVGAVWQGQWTTGPVEPFSSRGPTLSGLAKPDLVGPDGVANSTPGFSPFFGTSAATPHVAGAAALVFGADPDRGPGDVEALLLLGAVPYGGSGENLWGAGRLDLGFDFLPPAPDPPVVAALDVGPDSVRVIPQAPADDTPPVLFTLAPKGKAKKGQDALLDVPANALVDDGLRPDTRYRWTLRARDSAVPPNRTDKVLVEARTDARTPPAPLLVNVKATKAVIALDPADNPKSVRYAVLDETHGLWLAKDGSFSSAQPVYRSLAKWGAKIKVKGLSPGTTYTVRASARNSDGEVTPPGDPLVFTTPP